MTKQQAIEILNARMQRGRAYGIGLTPPEAAEALDRAGLFMSEETAAEIQEAFDLDVAEREGEELVAQEIYDHQDCGELGEKFWKRMALELAQLVKERGDDLLFACRKAGLVMSRFSCEAEREIYEKRGPARHASIARQIDDQMTLPRLLPYRYCNCDEGHHCRPHAAIHRIIDRAHETGRAQRARPAVETFVRRFVAAKERK